MMREMPVWLDHGVGGEVTRICTTDAAKYPGNEHCTHYVR